MQNKKGFTIIELIVVIAIIAILAAVVMVNVTQYINKSKIAAIQAEMNQLQKLAVIYSSIKGSYGSSEGDFPGCAAYNYNCPIEIGDQARNIWDDITTKINKLPGATGSSGYTANADENNFCMYYQTGSVNWCVDNYGTYQDVSLCGTSSSSVTCK